MSGFLVDISDLAGRPGASRAIALGAQLRGLEGPLGGVRETDPVDVDLVAESLTDGIEVTGRIAGRFRLTCSRCLADFTGGFEYKVDEVFYFDDGEEKGGYEVQRPVIDLEPMIRDAIGLGIPSQPLHDEACRGLCTVCGADLNFEDCGHREETTDLRWEPLKEALGVDRIETGDTK